MAFSSFIVIVSLFSPIFGSQLYETTSWIKEGDVPNICCEFKIEEASEVLFWTNNGIRIQALLLRDGKPQRLTVDQEKFLQQNKGWNFIYPKDALNTFCITKPSGATIQDDDQMKFTCSKVNEAGLGLTMEEETFVVRVHAPVSIRLAQDSLMLKEGESADVVCSARGYPGLRITWKDPKTDKILAVTSEESGEGKLVFQLQHAESSQHGAVYVCEARTEYPPNQKAVQASLSLSVALPPKIHLLSNDIYTKLGVTESVTFDVTGLPRPKLTCEKLVLHENGQVNDTPRGGRLRYTVTMKIVTREKLGYFKCRAVNQFGIDEKELLFTTKPSKPKVITPRMSQTSDYYLMGWQVRSRVPLENVTMALEELPSLSEDSSVPPPWADRYREVVYSLRPGTINNKTTTWFMLPTDENTPADEKWRHVIWHHLTNLSEATQYNLHLSVCNQHACHDNGGMESRANIDPVHVFKTPKFNGTNKVDPRVLLKAPVDRVYMGSSLNQPSGSAQIGHKLCFIDGGLLYGLLLVYLTSWILRM